MLIRKSLASLYVIFSLLGCSSVKDNIKHVYHSQFDPVFFIDGKEMTVVYLADENKDTGLIKMKAYIFLGTEVYGEMYKETFSASDKFKFKQEVDFYLKRESYKNINMNGV